MNNKKIFNFESKVLVGLTIEKEGHHPDELSRCSQKFIWAACRFCGEPSRIRKLFYTKAGSACHNQCRIETSKLITGYSRNKNNCPSHFTEKDWCSSRGLFRVYDAGKRLWSHVL
jgi:hypothetical protein